MKKKKATGITICAAAVLGIGILLWNGNKRTENQVVNALNEATAEYGNMNTSNDEAFSLRVDDMQMLLTTFAPSYSLLGVSTEEYAAKPTNPKEVFRSEEELHSPICDYHNALIYDERADRYYNVAFSSTENPAIPVWETAKELNSTVYVFEAPQTEGLESISIKRNADEKITLSSSDDMKRILDVLGMERTTAEESKNGIPMTADDIIDVDFNYSTGKKSTVYLYEKDGKFFVEQPYNGIYEISKEDYGKILSH